MQVRVQQLAVEVAIRASKEISLQALLVDPVMNSASAAVTLLDELWEVNRPIFGLVSKAIPNIVRQHHVALEGALFGNAAISASLTTRIVCKMLDGLTLIESIPSCAR